MRYPEFLKKGDTIGLVAPSFGVSGFPYEDRFRSACGKAEKKGYKLRMCDSIHGFSHGASNKPEIRAAEFMKMYLDDEVDFVHSVAGGELMCQIIPHLDFGKIAEAKPKWFAGYSDNTCLSFLLPVLSDTAAFYAYCFGEFGMRGTDRSQKEAQEMFTGKRLHQESYRKYDGSQEKDEDPLAGYKKTRNIVIKSINREDCCFHGRMIGGCLDVLQCLCGTVDIEPFLERYEKDGFIWFMEAYDPNPLGISRALWQLKNAGWFRYCRGFVFGRSVHQGDVLFDVTFEESLEQLLDYDVPIIYNCDIGHLPPSWTVIEGALATVKKEGSRCSIDYRLD